MEEKELQELERALQAATPAPWRASRTGMGRSRVAAPLQVRTLCGEVVSAEDACNAAVCADHEDAAAIAALRNAAPSLISELRAARRFRQTLGLTDWPGEGDLPAWTLWREAMRTEPGFGERSDRERSEPPAE